MARPRLDHIAWAQRVPGAARFDLASSAVATPDLAAMGLPHRAGIDGDPFATLDRLERALGERLGAPGGRVLVTAGASEANAAVFAGLLEPGDEVLVEHPGYEPLRAVPEFFGAEVRTFPRSPDLPVAAAVRPALGPRTKLVVLTHLHNPSGAALSERDVEELEGLAGERELRLLADETYREAVAGEPATLASRSRCWVATSTLTKVFGLGGLRVGWVAGDDRTRERSANARNALSASPSQPGIALALALVPHLDPLRARAHELLAANRARWARFAGRHPELEPDPAPRGVTTCLRVPVPGGGDALAAHALARHALAVTPGSFFGDDTLVRIALGGEPDVFATALDALEQAVASFAGTRAVAGGTP